MRLHHIGSFSVPACSTRVGQMMSASRDYYVALGHAVIIRIRPDHPLCSARGCY